MKVSLAVYLSTAVLFAGCGDWRDMKKKGKKIPETNVPTGEEGSTSVPASSPNGDPGLSAGRPLEEKALEMSKLETVEFPDVGFSSYYSLSVPWGSAFDEEKQESKLALTAIGFSKTERYEEGAKYPMTYCNDGSRYFFIRRNLRKLPPGLEGFKGSDAEVYLKDYDQVIPVGRYLEQFPSDEILKRYDKLNFPRLCEGDYASSCRVTVAIAGQGNIPGERFQTVLRFYLKDGEKETLVLTASTPTKTKVPEGQYFGCDLL